MDKYTFRNQILNLGSLTNRYHEMATEIETNLSVNEKAFFEEQVKHNLDYLQKIATSSVIKDLKFQTADINKLRLEIAENLIELIGNLEKETVQTFIKHQGKGQSFFKVDFISMLECIGYRYHDSKYLDKGSLKLNLINQIVTITRGNCDFEQADYLEISKPGAIDQFEDSHIRAEYKTYKTHEHI